MFAIAFPIAWVIDNIFSNFIKGEFITNYVDKTFAKKIARCLQQLEQTPRSHPNIKALKDRSSQ
ncbi:hypothetical protein GTQ43_11560 [Nostoc sp. KVJ3]|nr:hypothetical protein [Nostoc sp. KVJ3]